MAKAAAPCPVEEAIQIIGGKWKLLVLRSLLLNGPQRYNELLSSVTAISAKEIGGKWKLLVLRSLLLNGPQRYNELLSSVTAISAKELTRNLRELTNAGLVARDSGLRTARYDVTKLGKGLMPTFKKLLAWGTNLLAPR